MFKRILVANRGEIACRIIRTCQTLGVKTVAVYSEADRDALHVSLADEAHLIGPASVAESYLRREALIDVALRSGAEAIHPGYGLVSEDPEFVRLCAERGVVFIGPTPQAMAAVGHKLPARERATAAGVPVVPGHDAVLDEESVRAAVEAVGLPVVLKASAGGGGIGMSIVTAADDLAATLRRTSSAATRFFGDGSVYVERYLPSAKHVEVQVFGDDDHVVHLLHRDCSVQRRHQKVIEEAPAPSLDADLSVRITESAARLARSIGYRNAGTVEFLVADGEFYFLEMNARLQVEHPVTEAITGFDLVEAQLRVASGEPLPFTQRDVAASGHAIECRVYAEDPANGRPSPGTIAALQWPAGDGVRVDAGYRSGDVVTPFYDPLIAKIIVHGDDRSDAIRRMRAAVADTVIEGIKTNLPTLAAALAAEDFVAGTYDTNLLSRLAGA